MEETSSGEVVNQKTNSVPDFWSDEVTSEEGGLVGEDDDDGDGGPSYSLDHPPPNLVSPRNHQVIRKSAGLCDELGLMGKTHSDDDHREETVIRKEESQGLFTANVDSGFTEAEPKVGEAFPKESFEHSSQVDSRKKENHPEGKDLNGGIKMLGDQPPYGIYIQDPLLVEPHTHLHPLQTQSGSGPSDSLGPFWKNDGSNNDSHTFVAQTPNHKPEKYSKVYRRHRVSQPKTSQLKPVAEEPQVLEGITDTPISTDIQNQELLETEGKLKSIIVCNNQLLEEAHHLWELGTHMGMEVDKCHSDFIQTFADMEVRDRNEASELGERKTHR